jgi:hypothetical protein
VIYGRQGEEQLDVKTVYLIAYSNKNEGEIVFSNEVTVEYPNTEYEYFGVFYLYFNSTAIAYINANPIFTIGVIGEYDYNNITPENSIEGEFNLNGNGASPAYPYGQVG